MVYMIPDWIKTLGGPPADPAKSGQYFCTTKRQQDATRGVPTASSKHHMDAGCKVVKH